MSEGTTEIVEVSRRIEAPAHTIFSVLAHPAQHLEIDGSEMLRGATTDDVLTGVGDTFHMKMYYEQFGDYEMKNVVVEFDADRRIAWEPERFDVKDDEHWHHRWGFALEPDGDDATTVTEFYDCTRTPEEPRSNMKGGAVWTGAMTKTLERLASLMATGSGASGG